MQKAILVPMKDPSPTSISRDIRHDIAHISALDQLEHAHIEDALKWIDEKGAGIFRVAKPDVPPKHLVAYFVLIDPDTKSLLLGDHIKSGLWLPSGGHVELGETPNESVEREAVEELGTKAVYLFTDRKPYFITVTDTVGPYVKKHTDVSLWYLLHGSRHEYIDFEKREFRSVEWFTFDEILGYNPTIFDPHMQRFTRKLMQRLARLDAS